MAETRSAEVGGFEVMTMAVGQDCCLAKLQNAPQLTAVKRPKSVSYTHLKCVLWSGVFL